MSPHLDDDERLARAVLELAAAVRVARTGPQDAVDHHLDEAERQASIILDRSKATAAQADAE